VACALQLPLARPLVFVAGEGEIRRVESAADRRSGCPRNCTLASALRRDGFQSAARCDWPRQNGTQNCAGNLHLLRKPRLTTKGCKFVVAAVAHGGRQFRSVFTLLRGRSPTVVNPRPRRAQPRGPCGALYPRDRVSMLGTHAARKVRLPPNRPARSQAADLWCPLAWTNLAVLGGTGQADPEIL